MRKHALRRCFATTAVLASTLVAGVVNAPAAQAAATFYNGNDYAGMAVIDHYAYDGWGNGRYVYAVTAGANVDPITGAGAGSAVTGNQTPNSFVSGSSITIRWEMEEAYNGYAPDYPTYVSYGLRSPSGAALYGQQVDPNLTNESTMPISLVDPTYGTPLPAGTYQLFAYEARPGYWSVDSSNGGSGGWSDETFTYHTGTITVTAPDYLYLLGSHAEDNDPAHLTEQETDLGLKDFGLVRDFKSSWGNPSARVDDWADENKVVAWSTKPPNDEAAWVGGPPPGIRRRLTRPIPPRCGQ